MLAALLAAALSAQAPDEMPGQLLGITRVYVDRMTGGETAAQMRDLLIASLQNSKLFVLTENADRADAFLRGTAEDLIYTDAFSSTEGGSERGSVGASSGSGRTRVGRALSAGASDRESVSVRERKHEALAAVRLVNKAGDVMWSTTQESSGAKFRGASADVADKITRQLAADYDKLRQSGDGRKKD